MIRYALVCECAHEFDDWFASSSDFEQRQARGWLECPECASSAVRKQIMAPAVAGTKRRGEAPAGPQAMVMEALGQIRRHVEENFDDVGDAFAREARAIHEGRAEDRGIYGQATRDEVKSLVEDGVPVAPLPPAPLKKTEIN